MPRADTTLVRIDDSADEQLVKTARRLGVSKAALLAGFAAWIGRAGMPIELHRAIVEASNNATQRHADGSYRGSLARGKQIAVNGGPKPRP